MICVIPFNVLCLVDKVLKNKCPDPFRALRVAKRRLRCRTFFTGISSLSPNVVAAVIDLWASYCQRDH